MPQTHVALSLRTISCVFLRFLCPIPTESWKVLVEVQDMNEQETFLTLFLKHQDDLRAFIGSVVRERAAREDVLQETALVLWREFERFDHGRSFGAWARGIAAKKLLQRWDRGKRWHYALPNEAIPVLLAAFDRTEDLTDARRDALEHCLQTLPGKSQRLLALRYEQGHSLQQIAEQVGGTLDAVNKGLSRIRGKLRECIERRLRIAEEM